MNKRCWVEIWLGSRLSHNDPYWPPPLSLRHILALPSHQSSSSPSPALRSLGPGRKGKILTEKLLTPRFATAAHSSEGNQPIHPSKYLYRHQYHIFFNWFTFLRICIMIIICTLGQKLDVGELSGTQFFLLQL